VRLIWKGDLDAAERDLKRGGIRGIPGRGADDLGLVFAKRKRCDLAVTHFPAAIELDPRFKRHNLGICFYISGQHQTAREVVDAGLQLGADNRSSLVLKGAILAALGRKTEAQKITERSTLRDQGFNMQPSIADSTWGEKECLRYFDAQTGRLLGPVRRDARAPNAIHISEVNICDAAGRIVREEGSIAMLWVPQNTHHAGRRRQ